MSRAAVAAGSLVLLLACLGGGMGRLPAFLVPLAWAGALWLPGAPLHISARSLAGLRGWTFNVLWMPLATGPVIFGAGISLGRLAGLPLAAAAVGTIGLAWAGLLLRLYHDTRLPEAAWHVSDRAGRDRAEPGWPRALTSHPWLLPTLVGAGILLLALLPPLLHEPLRLRDDARLHLPVIQRILAGSFPPENPFLAGAPLGYFWFYHVVLAGVARLTGLALDLIPPLFSGQALLVLLLALDRLGRRMDLTPAARAAGLALVGLGLSPWGWMRLLHAHATHPELNWALIRTYGAYGLLPLLSPEDPRLAASLTKIAISNAFPMSLALFALAATPLRRMTLFPWLRRAVAITGCLLFHLATGLMLVAGLGLAWLLAWWRRRSLHDRESDASAKLGALGGLVLGVAIAVPYVAGVLAARSGGGPGALGFQPLKVMSLHLSLLGVWLLALPALPRWLHRGFGFLWLAVGVPALVLPFFVHLIDGNEYKSVFVLLVVLAPVAGAGLARLARGNLMVMTLVLVLFLPTPFLAAKAYREEIPPGVWSSRENTAAAAIGAGLRKDTVIWQLEVGHGYTPLTYPLGRPSYLSDPYALQIMGQWDSQEARARRGTLEEGLRGRLAEALAASRARVDGRPLRVAVPHDGLQRHRVLEAALVRLGWVPEASHPRFDLYAPPAETP